MTLCVYFYSVTVSMVRTNKYCKLYINNAHKGVKYSTRTKSLHKIMCTVVIVALEYRREKQ